MSRDLTKMTVLVTGATGGMGLALTELLSAQGVRLILVDQKKKKGVYGVDLSSYKAVEKLKKILERDHIKLDWVVHFAGWIDQPMLLTKQHPKNIDKTVAANLLSTMYIVKEFIPLIHSNGGIVTIASTAALRPNGRYAAYSAAKAGVIAFTQAVARSAPDLSVPNLSFITVCPGPTNTPMREKIAGDAKTQQSPLAVTQIIKKIILGCIGHFWLLKLQMWFI